MAKTGTVGSKAIITLDRFNQIDEVEQFASDKFNELLSYYDTEIVEYDSKKREIIIREKNGDAHRIQITPIKKRIC